MAYTSIANIRAVSGMEDVEVWPDADLTSAITYAEALIDDYCGTSFEYKAFSETVDGSNSEVLRLSTLYPQTLTSVTIDGDAQVTTGWSLRPEGIIVRDTGTFPYSTPGLNVSVSGTAGRTSAAPSEIALAARSIAISYLRMFEERIPERALSVQSEFGQIMLAQPGAPWRPTEFPTVNALLNRWRARPPAMF